MPILPAGSCYRPWSSPASPLGFEVADQIAKRNFSVDVLAFLSIVAAVALRQYWVAAIVVLMLSGGKALEEYATRGASSVLGALARRMPQIAHRVEAADSVLDLPVETIAAGMGISEVYGGKSPEEKVEIVRDLTSRRQTLFLGDGINDAPAMMNATVGISLGVNSDITS